MQLCVMWLMQLQFVDRKVKMGENDDFDKIRKKEKTANNCNENVEQYLLNSSLHGLRYVGTRNISYFERIFFGLAFILVTFLSGYFISNVYYKWSATPMIIALNSKSTPIGDIPFPAVTICNMNKAKESKVRKFVKNSLNEFLLEGLCNKRDNLTSNEFSSTWPQFRKFVIDVSHSCKEMLLLCKFSSETKKCMHLFNTILTDEGLCCTFNQVHRQYLLVNYNPNDKWDVDVDDNIDLQPSDWTPELGFSAITDTRNSYPRPGPGSGSHMGLTVVLNANIDEYHCSTTNSKGFKVLLHSPTETPQIGNFGFSITPGYESRVVVTPHISDASDKVRPIPQSQRNCVFSNEGNLTYFRTYSRKNCELECQSYIVFQACGCVLYYMPIVGNETTICNRDDYKCYKSTMQAIESMQDDTYSCKCLPGCFELSYGGDISSATFPTEAIFTKSGIIKKFGPKFAQRNIAIMHVYYEQNFFRSNSKEEFIGFTEFLSNTGGLLGLFLGFSVVSLIEILYFLTLRPYCAQRKQNASETKSQNSHKQTRKRQAAEFEGNVPFQRGEFVGRKKRKELSLFRPQIFEPVNRSVRINRYQYNE